MAGGGPLPVREFKSAAEMQAHAAALRAKMFPAKTVERPRRKPTLAEMVQIPAPDREVTEAAYLRSMQAVKAREHKGRSIVRIVSVVTGISVDELRNDRRPANVVKARHIASYIGHRVVGVSTPQMGVVLGNRDHSTICHGVYRVDAVLAALSITPSDDAVSLAQALWSADWSGVPAP